MDINLVKHAKDYLDDLAKGVDPMTKEIAKEDDIINNVKISRCLSYVSDVLGEIISNGGINKPSKSSLNPFCIDNIDCGNIEISDSPVTVSIIAQRINLLKPEDMKKLKVTALTNWLVSIGMLEVVTINSKNHKRVTASGQNLGLIEEEKMGQYGKYISISYNKDAQQFIIDNLNVLIDSGFNS